jgi:hypothetical protein
MRGWTAHALQLLQLLRAAVRWGPRQGQPCEWRELLLLLLLLLWGCWAVWMMLAAAAAGQVVAVALWAMPGAYPRAASRQVQLRLRCEAPLSLPGLQLLRTCPMSCQ